MSSSAIEQVAFIEEGMVRYFALTSDGTDSTKDFSLQGIFTLSIGSAALGRPAEVAIEAVEATQLVVWPYQILQDLYDTAIEWQKVGRRVAEFHYVRKEQRELSFLQQDTETRYRTFLAQFGTEAHAISHCTTLRLILASSRNRCRVSSRFSLAFCSSRAFSRLASLTSMPPNLAFHL